MSVLVAAEGLKKQFPVKGGLFQRERKVVHAVDGVDLSISIGETIALVGESGCGKTTVARLLLWLIKPTAGTIRFMGQDISRIRKDEVRKLRCEMQMIFQNPYASLNPRKKIDHILAQPYLLHKIVPKNEIKSRVLELLEAVSLSPAQLYINKYPHELSGGQRQRIAIARAIALRPKLIIADEPVSSLDMSVRAQILELMKQLKRESGLTYLYITHDLAMVRSICDRVYVMYLGKIMEIANVEQLFSCPLHPYTKALLSATPIANPKIARKRQRIVVKGEPQSPIDLPTGCRFHARCPFEQPPCRKEEPTLMQVEDKHFVACHKRI